MTNEVLSRRVLNRQVPHAEVADVMGNQVLSNTLFQKDWKCDLLVQMGHEMGGWYGMPIQKAGSRLITAITPRNLPWTTPLTVTARASAWVLQHPAATRVKQTDLCDITVATV